MSLLERLLLWIRPGVDDDPAPADPPSADPDPADPDPAAAAPQDDDLTPPADPPELAETAQQILARLDRRTEALERRQAIPEPAPREAAHAPAADPDYQAEEAQLERARQSGLSETDLGWMRWQIEQNRQTRETRRITERTASEWRDTADRLEFSRLEMTQPDLYRHYAPKVEALIAEQRARGGAPAPRGLIMRALMGDDLMKRKEGKRPAAPKATASPARPPIERTPLPRARSDVQARGQQSEREGRRRRLEGKQI